MKHMTNITLEVIVVKMVVVAVMVIMIIEGIRVPLGATHN